MKDVLKIQHIKETLYSLPLGLIPLSNNSLLIPGGEKAPYTPVENCLNIAIPLILYLLVRTINKRSNRNKK